MWVSERRERRRMAREVFLGLMWDTAAVCAADEWMQVHAFDWGAMTFTYYQGPGAGVSIDLGFIGATPMVAWNAGHPVRTIPTADGRVGLRRAVPADLLVAWRNALVVYHDRHEADAKAKRLHAALEAEARAALGFWNPGDEATIEDRLAFPFEHLSVQRMSDGRLAFAVKTKTLVGMSAAHLARLKALCDEVKR